MKRMVHLFIMACMIISLAVLSCSDSESRVPAYLKTAKVIINLGLPEEHAANSQSIIDRVLRFFARDAVAQTAPATFSSIFVRVTGPDMGPIEKTFAASSSISFEVPAGALRQFEVIAYVAPGDPSAAASFRGTGAASLPAGSTVSIIVAMSLYETKIVVPDYNYVDGRIVVLESVNSTTWKSVLLFDDCPEGCNVVRPYDIDFDSRGRMYVVTNSTPPDVYRYDNLKIDESRNGVLGQPLWLSFDSLISVAVDRERNYLYFANGWNLYRSNLDGTNLRSNYNTSFIGAGQIGGLDVAPDGTLIISDFMYNYIYRYDPDYYDEVQFYGQVIASNNYYMLNAADVRVWNNKVYVANTAGNNGMRILEFPLDFDINTLPVGYGDPQPTNSILFTTPPIFYGPQHFIAGRVNELIVIDEGSWGDLVPTPVDRLISIKGMSGDGWAVSYPGIGFMFYQ